MIPLSSKPNVEAPNADYPFGNLRDKSVSLPGTAVNKLVYADIHQFFEKLMDYAGVVPNGLPDNEYSGWQLMEALTSLLGGMKTKIINIGAWNMTASLLQNVPHGFTSGAANIREMSALIISDDGSSAANLVGNFFTGDPGGGLVAGATDVLLQIPSGSAFNSADYNSTSVNRGYLIIKYIDEL